MRTPLSRDVLRNTKISQIWRSYFEHLDNSIESVHKTPASVSVVAGGTPVGTVSGAQTWNDSTVYQVPEVAATPGFDVQFTFTNVQRITHIASNVRYSGSLTHQVEWQIYNNTDAAWETITQVTNGMGYNYRYVDFPNDFRDYINTSKETLVRLYHVSEGNAAHNVYVDYIALVSFGVQP